MLERGPHSIDVSTGKTKKGIETSPNVTMYLQKFPEDGDVRVN